MRLTGRMSGSEPDGGGSNLLPKSWLEPVVSGMRTVAPEATGRRFESCGFIRTRADVAQGRGASLRNWSARVRISPSASPTSTEPGWRNWQTRRPEMPVSVKLPCGFDPRPRHSCPRGGGANGRRAVLKKRSLRFESRLPHCKRARSPPAEAAVSKNRRLKVRIFRAHFFLQPSRGVRQVRSKPLDFQSRDAWVRIHTPYQKFLRGS